ncbi:MAG: hypothetical protein WD740_07000 [Anaerolineales bacterium]
MVNNKLFLFHWKKDEVKEYAEPLRRQGWEVEVECEDGARGAKAVKLDPPQVVVFYLTRLPSHSLSTADHIAQTRSLRQIPLLFVGGEAEVIAKTKQKIPSGLFINPEDLLKTLKSIKNKGKFSRTKAS